jgi:hypothetical protein
MKTNKIKDFFKSDKKYMVFVIICFLYAGFSLFLFAVSVYSGFVIDQNNLNEPRFDTNDLNLPLSVKDAGLRKFNPLRVLFSVSTLNFLFGGVISLISGLIIASFTMKKNKKEMTHSITNNLLLPNEKLIFSILAKHQSGLTQSKLTLESGLSKVQVHRLVKKLEDKGLIEKHKYGATNKLFLK